MGRLRGHYAVAYLQHWDEQDKMKFWLGKVMSTPGKGSFWRKAVFSIRTPELENNMCASWKVNVLTFSLKRQMAVSLNQSFCEQHRNFHIKFNLKPKMEKILYRTVYFRI